MDNLIVILHSLHLPDQYGQASDVINIASEVKSRTFFFFFIITIRICIVNVKCEFLYFSHTSHLGASR